MSGISARQPARTAKRTRPGDGATIAPPVLFRLPTIANAATTSASTSAGAVHADVASAAMASVNASVMSAVANVGAVQAVAAPQIVPVTTAAPPAVEHAVGHTVGPAVAQRQTSPVAAQLASTGVNSGELPENVESRDSVPTQTAAMTISAEKVAGQRLLNILIMLVLLAALVIITWISLQSPRTAGHMASQSDVSALDSLGELKVPEIQTGQPVDSQVATLPTASVEATELNSSPTESESLITGLDTNISGALSSTGTAPEPAAQIQLRPAVPVNNTSGSSLVSTQRSSGSSSGSGSNGSAGEPLTPATGSTSPRVETVSRPSSTTSFSPDLDLSEPVVNPATATPQGESSKPRTATQSGASPSLWDGAQNLSGQNFSNRAPSDLGSANNSSTPDAMPAIASGLTISDPLSANIAVPQSSSQSTQIATAPTSSRQTSPATTSTTSTVFAPEPAVTVGGGSREPYNLAATRSTSTPESDSAATIQMYQSYSQQRQTVPNASTAPTGVNSAGAQPINSYAIGAGTPIPGQNLYTQGYVNSAPAGSAPTNSYIAAGQIPAATPPGVTGLASGPFVPGNTPATAPSMQVPSQFVGGSTAAPPTMLPGYSLPQHPQQTTFNSYANPVYAQPGYPSATHNPGSSFGSASGFANPSFPTPGTPNPIQPSAPGQPAQGAWQPTPGATAPGIQHGASYPVSSSPYPGGQAPLGMMGPSGFATVPSGDFQPPRTVTGTVGYGVSVPNGIQ